MVFLKINIWIVYLAVKFLSAMERLLLDFAAAVVNYDSACLWSIKK